MDALNRAAVVGLAFAWVILMALVILLTWGADSETIDRLGDLVSYLNDHTDNASKLILTLGAAALIVLSLTIIVAELVPAEPARPRCAWRASPAPPPSCRRRPSPSASSWSCARSPRCRRRRRWWPLAIGGWRWPYI